MKSNDNRLYGAVTSKDIAEKLAADHGITVDVVSFKEREDKPITDIAVSVICERESHKRIVIGKNGALIKAAASEARKEIEELLDCKVFLECFVKVREGWRDDNNFINNNEF